MFTSVKQSHLKFQLEDEKKYVCVFEHNVEDGYFTSGNVEKYESRLRFSILNEIGEGHKIRGMYEFKLEYPDIDKYILWRQSKRPQDATDSDLREVEILYNDFIPSTYPFQGLRRSIGSASKALLDGSTSTWHYAVGQTGPYNNYYLAGPYGTEYTITKSVRLWLSVFEPNITINYKGKILIVLFVVQTIT